jgi:hypothetical protein
MRRFTRVWQNGKFTDRGLSIYLSVNIVLVLGVLGVAIWRGWF